jgi:hypothetical protein
MGTHFLKRVERETSQETETNEQARGTYSLESIETWTSRNTETNRASEGHSLPGERSGSNNLKSGSGSKPNERGVLTLWRRRGVSRDTEIN